MNTRTAYGALKRLFDISFSGAALVIISPAIAIGALAVKLDSNGPAFYKSLRVGRYGKPFYLIKLRSMRVEQSSAAPQVTAASDPRITRLGHWLRHTKLDELPQLWNVLIGDVSLVGPRPEVQKYVNCYPEHFKEILSVRPGLADQAFVQFSDEQTLLAAQEDPEQFYINDILPKKIELYLEYVRNPSLSEDTKVIVATARQIMRRIVGG